MRTPTLLRLLLTSFVISATGYAQTKVEGPVVMIVGPPLSGKSAHAATAARLLNLPVVSADDLIKANLPVFEEIRRGGISGMEPQSDPVLNRLFQQRLEKGDLWHGMILDGYPSTKDHCDYLAGMVKSGVLPAPLVIELGIPDQLVLQRAGTVRDVSRASIEQRLKDYRREMDVLHLYFPNADLQRIDGTKSDKILDSEVAAILKKRYGNSAKHPQ
jgi:adenylate kinase family enzyme